MEIKLYKTSSPRKKLVKDLTDGITLTGTLRGQSSIMSPSLQIQDIAVIGYNYCYIPDFRRYYFITSINAVSNEIYDVKFTTDVLMSFRGEILQYPVIVDKQTQEVNGDEYIDDSSLVTDNLLFSTVYNFSRGFLDNPEYILITAG